MADDMMGDMAAIEEEGIPEEQPTGEGTALNFTVEEIPELAEMQVGDTLTLTVDSIGEDGTFGMGVLASELPPEEEMLPPAEEAPMGELGGGQGDVMSSLVG